jgi:hypothetical protein
MSPQFVDFDADGRLDIVAGIYDGSPHLVRGTAKGWGQPEQILGSDGQRIVLNAFWDFDAKQWQETDRYDAKGHTGKSHATSAVAFDVDGDGDLDLLLGDHKSGGVFVRHNLGDAKQPKFALVNEPLHAGGAPIDVPGTVATLRLVDWNRDGRLDLACGGMGDSFGSDAGGGVYVYLHTGSDKAASFGPPVTLLERSKKDTHEPTRPDSGLYMDFGDHDGDGDLDMVVGGYSQWTPKAAPLTEEQEKRVAELTAARAELDRKGGELSKAMLEATAGLDREAAAKKRTEVVASQREQRTALNTERQRVMGELEALRPAAKRESFVWLYENTTSASKRAAAER